MTVFSRHCLGTSMSIRLNFGPDECPLNWRELSTFMGLADSPQIRSRILFTNCDELASVLNDRQGFFCIRGSDLDRLQPEDFRAIESWLTESPLEIPKKQPLEHQTRHSPLWCRLSQTRTAYQQSWRAGQEKRSWRFGRQNNFKRRDPGAFAVAGLASPNPPRMVARNQLARANLPLRLL